MYVVIRRYVTDPKSVAEVVRRIKEEFMPIIKQIPRFMAYNVLDAGNGTLASISTFQDKSGAEESTRRAADWVKTVSGLLPNPPQVTAGDLVIRSW